MGWLINRLLGLTIDDRLSWTNHLINVKKDFVDKLNMLTKKEFFLGQRSPFRPVC